MLQNSQENSCVRISYSINWQASAWNFIKKRYFDTSVFLWILRNFSEHLFERTFTGDCFSVWFYIITKFRIHSPKKYKVFRGNKTEAFWPLPFELGFVNFIFLLQKIYIPILLVLFIHSQEIFRMRPINWDKLHRNETFSLSRISLINFNKIVALCRFCFM